jgi:hypothetical protein
MQHSFFKAKPIITALSDTALHTAPTFEEEEQTLVEPLTATSSELKRGIPMESASQAPSQGKWNSEEIWTAIVLKNSIRPNKHDPQGHSKCRPEWQR